MQRVSRSSAVPSLPAAPVSPSAPGFFAGGNPGLGQAATVPGYEWFNAVQEELMAVILRGGLTASPTDLAQVRKSLDRLFGGGFSVYANDATLSVDQSGVVNVDATAGPRVITLPLASAMNGRPIWFQIRKNDNSANAVTVQRAGADLIEGHTTLVLSIGADAVTLVSDGGAAWQSFDGLAASSARRGLTRFATVGEVVARSADDLAVTPAGLGALLQGPITASGLTVDTASLLGRFSSGTGPIQRIPLANTSPNVALGINVGTGQSTNTGVQIDFTNIPVGVRRINLLMNAVSAVGNAKSLRLRIGPAAGVETAGYLSGARDGGVTDSFELTWGPDWLDSGIGSGSGIVTLMRDTGSGWFLTSNLYNPNIPRTHFAAGRKTITGDLTNLRLYWADNVAFDGGFITPTWEF